MFIVDLFKNMFSVIVVILLMLCALFGVVGLFTGQLLSIVIAAGGVLLVVLTFGLCGVILDMHTQLVNLNMHLTLKNSNYNE